MKTEKNQEKKEEIEKQAQVQEGVQPERKNEEEATKSQDPVQQLNEQVQELTELLQRTQANFENYRKQQEKRIEEIRAFASKNLIIQVLPILDNFELAFKTKCSPQDFLKGMELIYSQLFTILENEGLKMIPTEKCSFNPCYHEALIKEDSKLPENAILEELQKGFILNNQVIRHAKVKISSGKSPDKK